MKSQARNPSLDICAGRGEGFLVNAVRKMVDDANETNCEKEIKLVKGSVMLAPEESNYTMNEIQKRATEVGPVLEKILQDRWDHWGLNE